MSDMDRMDDLEIQIATLKEDYANLAHEYAIAMERIEQLITALLKLTTRT